MGKRNRSTDGRAKQQAAKAEKQGHQVAAHIMLQGIQAECKHEEVQIASAAATAWKRTSTRAECARGAAWIAKHCPGYTKEWNSYAIHQHGKPDVGSGDWTFGSSPADDGESTYNPNGREAEYYPSSTSTCNRVTH